MYKWDKEQISEKIHFFEQKESLSKQELESLAALRYLLGIQDENMNSTIHLNQHCMNIMKMQLLSFAMVSPRLKNYFFLQTPTLKETKLSLEDQLTLVHDFYKTQPSFVYQAFKKAFDQKHHLEIGKSYTKEAYCVFIKALQETYIYVPNLYSISTCYVLVHEYAHATQKFLTQDYDSQNWFFNSELASQYYERRLLDYLLLNHVEEKDALVCSLYCDYQKWLKANQLCDYFSNKEIDSILEDSAYLSAYLNALSFYQRKDGDEKMAQFIKEVPRSSIEGFFLPYKYVSEPNVAMMKAYQKRQKKLAKKYQLF